MSQTDPWTPFPDQGPFLEGLGPVLHQLQNGEPRFALQTQARHANPRGKVHGGALAALVDFAVARAIEADAGDDRDLATVSLTVDFLKPVEPGAHVRTRTSVDRVGGTLSFADCSLLVDGDEVARARAVYAVAG